MKFYVEKKININGSDSEIFNQIADFNNWENWSPWAYLEKGETSVSGSPKSIGHGMTWKGEITGEGEMNISSIEPNKVFFDVRFIKPWKSFSKNTLSVKEGEVVWTMEGNLPFFMFFMKKTMVTMLGMDFDRGLLMLKDQVETGGVETESVDMGVSEMEGFDYVGLKRSSSIDEMPKLMQKDMERMAEFMENKGKNAKKWIAVYKKFDFVNGNCEYISAFSSEELDGVPEGYVSGSYKTGRVYKVLHKGDYKYLGNSWIKAMMTVRTRKLKMKKGFEFESYLNDPTVLPPEQWETEVVLPLK